MAYPPIIIALMFVGVLICWAFRSDDRFGVSGPVLTAGAFLCALALVGVYYQDLIRLTSHSVYPGQRRSLSGTVSWWMALAIFAPSFNQVGFRPLGAPNICESGVVGSYLPAALFAFIDYRAFGKFIRGRMPLCSRRRVVILGAGTLWMLAWMFLPLPAVAGKPFFWQFVPAGRMEFPAGVLLTLLCLWLLNVCGFRFTVRRNACFLSIIVLSLVASKFVWSLGWADITMTELLFPPVCAAALLLGWTRLLSVRQAVVSSCVLANLALFALFNPLLSAKDIFAPRHTPAMQRLEERQRNDPRGWLLAPDYPGAVLNGLGFRSIQHVLLSPHLQFFREYFPEMREDEFNQAFNRYAHIHLGPNKRPYSPQADLILVPAARFGYTMDAPLAADWNGDGRAKVGVYHEDLWMLDWNGDGKLSPADRKVTLGGFTGDIPVLGRWNGGRGVGIGVFRGEHGCSIRPAVRPRRRPSNGVCQEIGQHRPISTATVRRIMPYGGPGSGPGI